jgi:glycogen debranching enzyme
MEDKGYYAQYLYGRNFLTPSKRFEALGEALAVLFDVADAKQSKMILSQSPITEYGVTCIYPQIPGIPPYHNDAIWPFVQSYWNLAAAKVGNEKVLNHGLASVYRAAGLFLTNYENMVAGNGDFKGTEINSHRMLWSMAGNLSMVYRVFMGMHFEEDRLVFAPVIPKNYDGTRSLKNFKYRNANLDITVEGFGNQIASVTIDGNNVDKAIIPMAFIGKHTVNIKMSNNDFSSDAINLVENKFTLANPIATLSGDKITWQNDIKENC